MSKLLATALVVLALQASCSSPVVTECKLRGGFSSLKYNEESGDLTGYEMHFIHSQEGVFAAVQVAEGTPNKPFISPVTGNCRSFEFPFYEKGVPEGKLKGSIEGEKLKMKYITKEGATIQREYVLKRSPGYWHK